MRSYADTAHCRLKQYRQAAPGNQRHRADWRDTAQVTLVAVSRLAQATEGGHLAAQAVGQYSDDRSRVMEPGWRLPAQNRRGLTGGRSATYAGYPNTNRRHRQGDCRPAGVEADGQQPQTDSDAAQCSHQRGLARGRGSSADPGIRVSHLDEWRPGAESHRGVHPLPHSGPPAVSSWPFRWAASGKLHPSKR